MDYKVGDKIRIIKDMSPYFTSGKEAVITGCDGNDNYRAKEIDDPYRNNHWSLDEFYFELVTASKEYKKGDKVRMLTGQYCEMEKGDIVSVQNIDFHDKIFPIKVDDGKYGQWVTLDDIELVDSNSTQEEIDKIYSNRNGANVSSCRHEFIVVGIGLYSNEYIDCKHCGKKKEDCEEEPVQYVVDDPSWDIPF